MRILAIETSCDETAVCVLEARGNFQKTKIKILSNIVASQVKIHAKWGGVVPNLAKREHQKNLPIILKKALREAKILPIRKANRGSSILQSRIGTKIDLIAVTNGPGLEPALWVGINFAQELAKKWKKPLLPINHMEGHLFSVFLKKSFKFQVSSFKLPAIALLVSGGHTELVLIKKLMKYKVIGQTLDDAAGEAFDKVARLLGLGYPGGPAIAAEAAKIRSTKFEIRNKSKIPNSKFKIQLPRPMISSKDYNFSFFGLKTAVLYLLRDLDKNRTIIYDRRLLIQRVAHEFQQAVIDVLLKKTMRAAREYRAKTIILGGGVAANKELRRQFSSQSIVVSSQTNLLMPEMEFTGDNAAMIALSAYFRANKKKTPHIARRIVADSNLRLK